MQSQLNLIIFFLSRWLRSTRRALRTAATRWRHLFAINNFGNQFAYDAIAFTIFTKYAQSIPNRCCTRTQSFCALTTAAATASSVIHLIYVIFKIYILSAWADVAATRTHFCRFREEPRRTKAGYYHNLRCSDACSHNRTTINRNKSNWRLYAVLEAADVNRGRFKSIVESARCRIWISLFRLDSTRNVIGCVHLGFFRYGPFTLFPPFNGIQPAILYVALRTVKKTKCGDVCFRSQLSALLSLSRGTNISVVGTHLRRYRDRKVASCVLFGRMLAILHG